MLTYVDIDYMNKSKVFTLGDNFQLSKMRDLIDQLHSTHQHYIVMVRGPMYELHVRHKLTSTSVGRPGSRRTKLSYLQQRTGF
jgi:hypothetical protein